jgi:uncharacterized protein YPO0396
VDITTFIAILAGVSGAATGIGALIINRKDADTRADTGYVDYNLKAMQAIVEAQIAENQRQRDRAQAETTSLRDALTQCEGRCNECLAKVKLLETKQPPTTRQPPRRR